MELPSTLKKIGGSAFAKCSSLREVVCSSPKPASIASSTFKGIPSNCRIIVPRGSKNAYRANKTWNKLTLIVEQ